MAEGNEHWQNCEKFFKASTLFLTFHRRSKSHVQVLHPTGRQKNRRTIDGNIKSYREGKEYLETIIQSILVRHSIKTFIFFLSKEHALKVLSKYNLKPVVVVAHTSNQQGKEDEAGGSQV
jgi:hypothetical protein